MSTPPLLQPGYTWSTAATQEGDDLASLASRYAAAWPNGANLDQAQRMIVQANGIAWRTRDIDAWVYSVSGKRRPFVSAANSPDGKSGWAVFAAGNQILLPVSLSTSTVEFPPLVIDVPAPSNHKGLWVAVVIGTSALLAALLG